MQFLKCVECGKPGHIKCTKEKESNKILVDVQVKDDLEEFVSKFVLTKEQQKNQPATKFVGAVSDDSDDQSEPVSRDLKMSFDYIDDIKQSEQPLSSLGKKDSWVKNSTNIHVPNQSTYMQAFRKA